MRRRGDDADLLLATVELVEVIEAANSLGTPAPVARLIGQWRRTAEVHADPSLVAILAGDHGDFGDVPAPGAAAE